LKRLAIMASVATVGLAILAVLAVNPASAAASPRSAAPHTHQMGVRGALAPAAATPLKYQGGAVETTPAIYISWWGSQWNTGFSTGGYTSAQAQTYITGFFGNVGGST
jgi:hypothetical protein